MRGDPAQGKFTIWYLSDGLLVAALTAGRSDDLDIASFLVGSRDGGGSWL